MGSSIKPGIYRGHAVAGTEQYGLSEQSEPQIALDVYLPELEHTVTVSLSCHPNALPYTIKRLRACGWAGKVVTDLKGIDTNEIDVQLFFEEYKGRARFKAEIMTAGGTFKLDRPLEDVERKRLADEVLRQIEAMDRAADASSVVAGARRGR
jgi:hypothetical protein